MMKRILFVDDEPNVLQGLRRMLRPLRDAWEIETAESGDAALKIIQESAFDVIVSDMRMPGMSGTELLTRVREKYPQMVRIMLSGESDQESLMRAVDCTHQYLSKPCDAATLKATVDRACALKNFLENAALRRLVSRLHSLPSLPVLYTQIVQELSSPEPSIEKISRIITRDPSMTAKLLQLVNSSFFSFYSHVTDPSRAVTILGLDKIRSLVLSIHIFASLKDAESERFNLQALWDHNLITAQCARRISESLSRDKLFQEQAYMAGLLHDIGKVILMANLPDDFAKVFSEPSADPSAVWEAEIAAFGAGHGETGAYLLGLWGLPSDIVQAVAFHHNPGASPDQKISPLTCVHAANCLLGESQPLPYQGSSRLDADYLAAVGAHECVPAWREGVQKIITGETS